MAKKIPAGAGRVRGKTWRRQKCLVQSRPADQPDCALLQVKVAGKNCFDVLSVGALLHWIIQFYDAAELIAVAIFSVGQDELRVVLGGHEFTVRLPRYPDCELEHKKLRKGPKWPKTGHRSPNLPAWGLFRRKIRNLQGHGAQK